MFLVSFASICLIFLFHLYQYLLHGNIFTPCGHICYRFMRQIEVALQRNSEKGQMLHVYLRLTFNTPLRNIYQSVETDKH